MDWLHTIRTHAAWDAATWVLLAALTMAVRQLAHGSRFHRYLDGALLLIASGILVGGIAIVVRLAGVDWATPYLDAIILSLLLLGCARLMLTLFVDFYLHDRKGTTVSAIFRDAAGMVLYFIVVVVVLRTTLDVNLASVIATSAVLTAIIGLALQDVLTNLFSGLVIEVEAPFQPGDWVRVGSFEGVVEETGWRSMKLRTRTNELVTVPNTILSKEAIVNYSRPDPLYGDTLHISAAYETAPSVVRETIVDVFLAHHDVMRERLPDVRLVKYGDSGIEYAIRYWICDFARLEGIRNELMSNLWYAFRREGIRIPFPIRDVYLHQPPVFHPVDATPRLRAIPLFAPLTDDDISRLGERLLRQTFGSGEVVVHEGDPAESFYIIESGTAEVTVRQNGAAHVVGFLRAGDFFGEMSLLTGEPRTATVRVTTDLSVLEIDRNTFREILVANPAILEPVSEYAARRQREQEERRREISDAANVSQAQQVQRLRERIMSLFGL